MPLDPKASIGENVAELHKGPQYEKTKTAHGAGVANRQAVAIAEKTAGNSKPKLPRKDGEPYADWLARKAKENRKGR